LTGWSAAFEAEPAPSRNLINAPTNENGGALSDTAVHFEPERRFVLGELVGHVVEGRVQLVADALHRANGRNSDKSRDQAILDGSRTLFVTNQLQKLAHGLSPWFRSSVSRCSGHNMTNTLEEGANGCGEEAVNESGSA
jgi:hypothetical protein